MSRYDYEVSKQLAALDPPFWALIMAAMRKADSYNAALLWAMFPKVHEEFEARYNTSDGKLPEDGL